MRVFNETKTVELTEYDLNKGYLKDDKIFVAHHEAVEGVAEEWHYETIREYSNGGKEVKKVIDVPAVPYQAEYDEYEDIQVFIPYTEKELASRKIAELKAKLEATDYQAIKYAEGAITAEEYAEMKTKRQAWREMINALEGI